MSMFPKDGWEVNDTIVVNEKHGVIKEFSSDNKKAYVEHRDNENQPYVRWYAVDELPAFKAEQPHPLPPAPLRSLTLTDGEGEKTEVQEVPAAVVDDLPDDVEALKKIILGQKVRLENQAASIELMMKDADEALQDKFDQLNDDYEALAKNMETVATERDNLKKVNEQQSELLKQAAAPAPFSTDVNPQKIIDSLRTENKLLERDNDKLKADLAKALQSPYEALEIRLAGIEEKLADAADWIEGAVERSMDEADMAAERRVLELSQPVSDYAPLFLVMAKAFASAAGDVALKAVG
jgi:hypothetical protein